MSYTLSDFLSDKIIPELTLLTKNLDFSRIPVRSACVQELPIENLSFVQPGEIVLSTGIGAEKDPGCLWELIYGAGNARAAAIVFSFKEIPEPFPADCISYADSISLPVFLMPWKYRFSSVQARLLTVIQEKELSLYKVLQNRLFNDFFESASLTDAAKHIACSLRCTAEIIDSSGHYVTGFTPSRESLDLTEESLINDLDIRIGDDLFGTLRLITPMDHSFFPAAADWIEKDEMEKYTAFPLSLWFNRKRIEDMTAARLKNDFVWNLAHGNYSSFDEMARQGRGLGLDLEKPYTCLVMHAVYPDGPPSPQYSSQTARDSERAEAILADTGADLKLSVMAAGLNRQYIIYVEARGIHPEKTAEHYIDMAELRLRQEFPGIRCLWGISESPIRPDDYIRLYKNASLALHYCMNRTDSQTRFTYRETKKARIISVLSDNQEIMENARETMSKLMEYDKSSGMGLLDTLAEYIRCGCNTSRTARALHIHRQSLLYRLEKIESLTEMSLNDPDDRFVLEVFSRIFAAY